MTTERGRRRRPHAATGARLLTAAVGISATAVMASAMARAAAPPAAGEPAKLASPAVVVVEQPVPGRRPAGTRPRSPAPPVIRSPAPPVATSGAS